MAQATLTFLGHESIEDFKANIAKSSKLEVMKNPLTGKLFFSCGSITGAVSSKGIPSKDKVQVAHVKGEDNAEFWLLCERGSAEVLAEF